MDRVTRAEAARRLGLDRATVTRWVQKNPALLDADECVSLEELERHRNEVINPKLQTRGSGFAAPRTVQRSDGSPQISLNDTRTRTESAKAESAELDLADRLRLTLRRDQVESAIVSAAEIIKQTAQALARDRAETLARITDQRHMELALAALMDDLMQKASQALTLAANADEVPDASAAA